MLVIRSFFLLVLSAAAGMGAAASAAEEDAGLYALPPPPDSAYVRLIAPAGTVAQIEGLTITTATDGWTDYKLIPAGHYPADIGEARIQLTFEAGQAYTLTDKLIVLIDSPNTNPAKAQLSLYNLTDLQVLKLQTADGTPVLAEVGPGTSKSRLVNGVSTDLKVVSNGMELGETNLVLQRGQSYSLVATGQNGQYRLVTIEDAVSP